MYRPRCAIVGGIVVGLLLGACECQPEPTDERPAEICEAGGAVGDGPFFTEISAELGMGPDGLLVEGNTVATVDLDGDRWPDLYVAWAVRGARDDFATSTRRHVRLLRNLQGRGFEDVTLASGFTATRDGEQGRAQQFAAFADFDNDGDQDAFTATFLDVDTADTGDHSEALRNRGDGTFEFGPINMIRTPNGSEALVSVAVLDHDRDGLLDLFVGFHYDPYGLLTSAGQDSMFRGNGTLGFDDATRDAGLTTDSVSDLSLQNGRNHRPTWGVSACDLDDNGWPDLLVSSYGRQFNPLWLASGDGTYTDQGQASGFWSDDREDYFTNDYYRCHCHNYGNSCSPMPAQPRIVCPGSDPWDPGFSDQPFRLGGNSALSACGDLDNDGDLDVLQIELRHWTFAEDSDPTELLYNEGVGQGGAFARPGNEVTGLSRSNGTTVDWNDGDLGGALFDFDHDGQLDALVASSDYPGNTSRLWHQQDDGTFTNVTLDSGLRLERAHGLSLVDLDRDGDLDVVMGQSSQRWYAADYPPRPEHFLLHVYRNDVGQDRNRLMLHLEGAGGSNRDAIGARITVRAGDDLHVREVQGGHGLAGQQHDLLQIIGIGPHCTVDEVTVRWPDAAGTVTTYEDVRANYVLRVHQADGLSYQSLEEYAPR